MSLGGRAKAVLASAVVLVLAAVAVVVVVTLWPDGGPGNPERTSGQAPAGQATDQTPDAAALAGPRQRAALAPCPTGPPGSTGPAGGAGPLTGVVVPCLGADGQVDLGRAIAGRTVLLNLWASWCEPCRAELPALASYAARPGAVPVLLVNLRDAPDKALALLADLRVRLPSVSDPAAALRTALRAPPALPVSYLVRADGSVSRIDPPLPFRSADEIAAAVARYVGTGT